MRLLSCQYHLVKRSQAPNKSTLQPNRVSLLKLSIVCEKYEVSDKGGVIIASTSSTLKAFGIVTAEDRRYVVERSKLRRGSKTEEMKVDNNSLNSCIPCFFHKRKDATVLMAEAIKSTTVEPRHSYTIRFKSLF